MRGLRYGNTIRLVSSQPHRFVIIHHSGNPAILLPNHKRPLRRIKHRAFGRAWLDNSKPAGRPITRMHYGRVIVPSGQRDCVHSMG